MMEKESNCSATTIPLEFLGPTDRDAQHDPRVTNCRCTLLSDGEFLKLQMLIAYQVPKVLLKTNRDGGQNE